MLTVAQAAERLGVSRHEVHRLVARGDLTAERAGSVFLLHEDELRRRNAVAKGRGRLWSPVTAWAAVELLDGASTRLIDQPRTSRLRARLRTLSAEEVHRLAGRRAATHRFHASSRARSLLEAALRPAGVSVVAQPEAARRFGLTGVEREGRLEGYLEGDLDCLVRRCRLTSDAGGEVTVRQVPPDLGLGDVWGCVPLTALDLMDSVDPRERARGRDVLDELLQGV